jgi:hypothetical protein
MTLVTNEAINRFVVVGLGRSITQLDVFFFVKGKVHVESKEVSIIFASRCEPLFWLLLYVEFCCPWSARVKND